MKHWLALMFHKVGAGSAGDHLSVSVPKFVNYINLLQELGYRCVAIHDALSISTSKIAISFDDGNSSDYEIVFPRLLSMGGRATFFVVPSFVGKKHYLSEERVREMSEAGMEIGTHTFSHVYLHSLPVHKIREEIRKSKATLEDWIEKKIVGLAVPGGMYSRKVLAVAKEEGLKYMAVSKPWWNCDSSYVVHRIPITTRTTEEQLRRYVASKKALLLPYVSYLLRSVVKNLLDTEKYIAMRRKLLKAIPFERENDSGYTKHLV